MSNSISGLDMGPTVRWYEENKDELRRRLNWLVGAHPRVCKLVPGVSGTVTVELGGHSDLSEEDVASVFCRFPEEARRRMSLKSIEGSPTLWFHRDSRPGAIRPTPYRDEALSPTAIIPSYIEYVKDERAWCGFSGRVMLYTVPSDVVPDEDVRRVVHLEGLVHELAHSFITPELYNDCELWFVGDGKTPNRQLNTEFFVAEAWATVNSSAPVSHYASSYTDKGGKLLEGEKHGLTPLNEALAEGVAALLCGFAYRTDGTGLEPFRGRRRLFQLVSRFLRAQRTLYVPGIQV